MSVPYSTPPLLDSPYSTQAKLLKTQGLKALNLEEGHLAHMAKGAVEKKVLAWFIKCHTTVSNAWVSEQLYCGHPANVSGYVKAVRGTKDRKIQKLAKALIKPVPVDST